MRRVAIVLTLMALLAASVFGQSKEDDKVYDQVRLKLAGDVGVNGGAIEVEVKDGAVTLKGKVRTEKARLKAEKLAGKVKGVRSVINQLKVDTTAH